MLPRSIKRAIALLTLLTLSCCGITRAQSSRPGWGATPYHDASGTGVVFRVWAPNATNVHVPGQFNGWSTAATALAKELTNGVWNGNWSADVASATNGSQYKFYLSANGSNFWKQDPRARLCQYSGSGGNSIIYDPAAFNWTGENLLSPAQDDLVIYELHIGTFCTNGTGSRFLTATNRLDYLRQLGVSAVEIMPIAEFPNDSSWGYNPAQPFAVENIGYGGPDGFKTFVKACHARGLAVLLDVVHNHYSDASNRDLEMWNFDGWAGSNSVGGGGIYFCQSNISLQVTPWGNTRPNFASNQVCGFVQDNFSMWLAECHVDGFRWDATSAMLYDNDNNFIGAAGSLVTAINGMIHTNYSGKISISEDIYDAFGFDSAWDTAYPRAVTSVLTNTVDASRNLAALTNALASNVRYHGAAGLKRVAFLESHDVTGDLNNGTRLVTAIDPATPNSWRARKLSLLGAALTFTAPGVPMIFQGQEMLESQQFSDGRPVDWTKTNTYNSIVRCYRDLAGLRRNFDGGTPGLKGSQISFLQVDTNQQFLAYRRWQSGNTAQDTVVAANLAGTGRTNYSLTFPRAGNWYAHFNSDSTNYSGDFSNLGTNVVAAGANGSAAITIGPYSVMVFSQTPLTPALTFAVMNQFGTVSWPASYAAWTLEKSANLNAGQTWTTVPASQIGTNGAVVFAYTTNSGANVFYRLRKN